MADWIQWFCSMEGHDFFCEVDRSFIGTILRFLLFNFRARATSNRNQYSQRQIQKNRESFQSLRYQYRSYEF